jgi:flagellar biogenesis protein FliO
MFNWLSGSALESMAPGLDFAVYGLGILFVLMIVIWIFRRIGGGTFIAGGIHRHRRLSILDAAAVDTKRRLVLVRRDDHEHLLLIGGATDIVVERNIAHRGDAQAKDGKKAGTAEETNKRAKPAAPAQPSSAVTESGQPAKAPAQAGIAATQQKVPAAQETAVARSSSDAGVPARQTAVETPPIPSPRPIGSAPATTQTNRTGTSSPAAGVNVSRGNKTDSPSGASSATMADRASGVEKQRPPQDEPKPHVSGREEPSGDESSSKPKALDDEMERLLKELSSRR